MASGMLIYSGGNGRTSTILTNRVSSAIGKGSYSLYLVHWPIIVFYGFTVVDANPSWGAAFIMIAAMVIAAAVSYFGVELPFREYSGQSRHNRIRKTLLLLPSLALLILAASTTWSNKGFPSRFEQTMDLALLEEITSLDKLRDQIVREDLLYIRSSTNFTNPTAKKILVVGDSHARDAALSLRLNLAEADYEIRRYLLRTSASPNLRKNRLFARAALPAARIRSKDFATAYILERRT